MGIRLNNLPEEIILEILTRLPTEDALECKLVCKPWRNLVRHPSFSQMHLKHLNENDSGYKARLIFFSYNNPQYHRECYYTEVDEKCDQILLSRKIRLNLSPPFQNCYFLGSCNGLICFDLSNLKSHNVDVYSYGPGYICNPITREYFILPNIEGVYWWNGFGYSASTNEYKVVRICFTSDDPNFGMAQVYTLGGGNGWRSLGEMGMNWKNLKYKVVCSGVFANGALHWVNRDNGSVLAFDLADEKFSDFPSPPCLAQDGVTHYPIHLGVLGNFLCAMSHRDADCSEIWLLKKDTDNSDLSWSKQFNFNSYIGLMLPEFTKSGRILCYGRGEFFSYNPKASSAKMDVSRGMSISEAIPHKNTLVSLKALGEKDTKMMEFSERARSSEVIEKRA